MKWISVKDRLPEKNKQVIVFCPHDFPVIGENVLQVHPVKGVSINFINSRVTHWMPLPPPPSE